MTESERAQAMATFLAWPVPARSPAHRATPRAAQRRGWRLQLRAAGVALALGLVLSVCSMLAPLAGAAGAAWGTGASSHLLLFCHLAI